MLQHQKEEGDSIINDSLNTCDLHGRLARKKLLSQVLKKKTFSMTCLFSVTTNTITKVYFCRGKKKCIGQWNITVYDYFTFSGTKWCGEFKDQILIIILMIQSLKKYSYPLFFLSCYSHRFYSVYERSAENTK